MALTKIAYLTPLYFDEKSYLGGGERFPLNLALGWCTLARGACQVELVSYGDHASRLHPGVTLRVLRADNRPGNLLDVGLVGASRGDRRCGPRPLPHGLMPFV